MIPKIIHCCWFGRGKTKLALKCRASWAKQAPDWQVHEWDETNVAEFRDLPGWEFFAAAIAAKKFAMASDWLRMAVLWKFGGLYLDCDVELVGDPTGLCLEGEWVAGEWTPEGSVCQNPGGGLALRKGSRVAWLMMEEYGRISFDARRDMMPWIVGALREVFARAGVIRTLPPEVMSPIDCRGVCHRTAATRGIHHYAMSWASPRRKMAKWLSWHGLRGLVELMLRLIFHARSGWKKP